MTSARDWVAILRKTVEIHPDIPDYAKTYILTYLDKIEMEIKKLEAAI